MSGKKAPARAVDRRFAQALELFERGVKALGKKDFERARGLFDSLVSSHREERDLLERARAYRAVCERALDRRPHRPKGFEDLLNYGVYLHNRGEYEEALKYLQQAADIHPKNENLLYCLAAAAARAGEAALALKSLRSVLAASPATRAQVRSDSDFDPLKDDAEFQALVNPQAS